LAIQAQHWAIYPPNGGFDVLKAREVYSIPEGYDPVAAIALGYMIHKPCLKDAATSVSPTQPQALRKVCSLVAGTKPHHWSGAKIKAKSR